MKLKAGICAIVFIIALVGVLALRGHSKTTPAKIVHLKPAQQKELKKVDTMVSDTQKTLDSLRQQRVALITGFAVSLDETEGSGLDWARDYDFAEDSAGYGFRKLTDDEKKQRAEAQAAQGQVQIPQAK